MILKKRITARSKMSLLLLLMVVIPIINLLLILQYQNKNIYYSHIVNVSGRQRMLTQKITKLTLYYSSGYLTEKNNLIKNIELYSSSLEALQYGGEIMGVDIPSAPKELELLLKKNRSIWTPFEEKLNSLFLENLSSLVLKNKLIYIKDNNEKLLEISDAVTVKFEEIFNKRKRTFRSIMIINLGLNIFIFVIGLFVTKDIIARKKMNDSLNLLNSDLEKRVDKRTNELSNTLTQLAESAKMAALGGLTAGITHEVATPLGIGLTAASFIQLRTNELINLLKSGEMTKKNLNEYLSTVEESSSIIISNQTRASEIMNSFKEISVDQTAEEKRNFNLKEYIDVILLSLKPRLRKTRHVVEVTCDDIYLFSYPGAFSQILSNFIMNSLIHGFENIESGTISIVAFTDNSKLHLKYSDNGIGVNESDLKKIFDPFFTTKRGKGGSGIGTNIVYSLVTKALKGSISCNSKKGEGIFFDILIPLKDK